MSMNRIIGKRFIDALLAAGIVHKEDHVTRIVIDATADSVVKFYVERQGDERLLSVATTLEGIAITRDGDPA